MRATVLRDRRLAKHAGRFVWLSIDTEDARNAEFVARFPLDVWPTLLVIDPGSRQVRARWTGGATVEQLEAFLAGTADATHPEALAIALQGAGRYRQCAAEARARAPSLARGESFALLVAAGLSCALTGSPDFGREEEALDALEPLAREALQVAPLPADDRAGLYESLVELRRARGDATGARSLAERWWAFLDAERRRGRSAEERAALDSFRVSAALALGDATRGLAPLAASERELPKDYNPPARRARLLAELGRFDDARAAAARALARAYGPRKVRVYQLAALVEERSGDRAAAARLLRAGLRYAEGLPPAQRNARAAEALRTRLAELDPSG